MRYKKPFSPLRINKECQGQLKLCGSRYNVGIDHTSDTLKFQLSASGTTNVTVHSRAEVEIIMAMPLTIAI